MNKQHIASDAYAYTDEEILEWCFTRGRRPGEEEIEIWNAFIAKRGWRDAGSADLQSAKERAGWLADPAAVVQAARTAVKPLQQEMLPAIQNPLWQEDLSEETMVYVAERSFQDYFCLQDQSRGIPKWLRKHILDCYGRSCFACDKALTAANLSIDHIIPRSKERLAAVSGLSQAKHDRP